MTPNRSTVFLGHSVAAVVVLWLLAASASVRAQDDARERLRGGPGGLPPGLDIQIGVGGSFRFDPDGSMVIEGGVTVRLEDALFQADTMRLTDKRWIEATGNILLVWGTNRIAGSSMTYDLEEDHGTITDAIGQVDPEYEFSAESAEKIGEDVVVVRKAEISTCTQPVPYWSFRVSKARIRIDGYAKMWNARLRARNVPFFYLPFLLWPVKDDRAPGLLLTEIHNDSTRGFNIIQPVYIPIGRSVDVTLTGSYYTRAGFGLGTEVRFVPNREGSGSFSGFFIDDKVTQQELGVSQAHRYRYTYKQTQNFRNGFRMVADINGVSDFKYFNDYERELELTSTPNVRTRLEFSRNGSWVSLNARELRVEQLFSDGSSLVQQALPEIELRGRSRQLGETPLYLSFETSMASIQQWETASLDPVLDALKGTRINANYMRGDFFPTLTIPWSPVPWLDINPRLQYRYTYYTQSLELFVNDIGALDRRVVDEPLERALGSIGVEILGPRFYRIFETPDSRFSKRYKNTIEPFITYDYRQGFDRLENVIVYDEIDRFGTAGNSTTYGIRSRLFARKPRSKPTVDLSAGESIVMPGGISSEGQTRADAEAPAEETDVPRVEDEETLEPVEIATLSLSQTSSFNNRLSSADIDGDGILDAFSSRSDIGLNGRFNPVPNISIDLRSNYQVLYKRIRDVSISGSLSNRSGRLRFALTHQEGLGVTPVTLEPVRDRTQLTFDGGMDFIGGKVRFDLRTAYNATPLPGQRHVPEAQIRFRYSTQCCTILVERLVRDFAALNTRNDWYFRVDLRGVGKILDQRF